MTEKFVNTKQSTTDIVHVIKNKTSETTFELYSDVVRFDEYQPPYFREISPAVLSFQWS